MFSPLALSTRFRGTRARGETKGKGWDREMGFTLTLHAHVCNIRYEFGMWMILWFFVVKLSLQIFLSRPLKDCVNSSISLCTDTGECDPCPFLCPLKHVLLLKLCLISLLRDAASRRALLSVIEELVQSQPDAIATNLPPGLLSCGVVSKGTMPGWVTTLIQSPMI